MMQDVSDQMLRKFTEAMRTELERPEAPAAIPGQSAPPAAAALPASPAEAPPIEVVSFGSQIVGRAAARALRRPVFWMAAAVVLLALYWLLAR
jgi:hypothetical protein